MRPRRSGVAVVAALALAVLGASLAWRWWSDDRQGVLVASGVIEATEVEVSFRIPGRLIERAAQEGQRIGQGALVARLESRELEAEVERLQATLRASETRIPQLKTEIALQSELAAARIGEARATLVVRRERLNELRTGSRRQDVERARAELREAKATMENARADWERTESLFRQELIAAQQRDQARTAFEVTAERYRAATERLDLVMEGPRVEEIRRAEAEVRQAEAMLALARAGLIEVTLTRQQLATLEANVARDRAAVEAADAQLAYTIARSPMAGVVLRKHVEPGEMIAAGTPIITLADLGDIWLKIYIPEPRLGWVKLGQSAEVTTDSHPGKVYRGRLIFISSEAEFTPKNVQTQEERVKLVFAVKIAVDDPDQELKPGMPADATIHLR